MVAVFSESPAFCSTRTDLAPPTRRALEGGSAVSPWGDPWPTLVKRPVRRPPEGDRASRGQSERAGDPVCVLRRRPDRRLRYSGVPRVVAFFTTGSDVILRQRESQTPAQRAACGERPCRGEGRRRGRQAQMVEDFAHDGGIGKERENNHGDGLRGGRAFGTRERIHMHHAKK